MVSVASNISALANGLSGADFRRDRVLAAIQKASVRSGVDFTYLVNKASQESSLDPTAKASGSSATGLYQFIDQTWLQVVKGHGAEAGIGDLADKITIGSNGVARVADAADKKAILALRKNPEIAAQMAAALANDNKESLQRTVGGNIGSTELYMAHFLGTGGATAFLKTMKVSPDAKAASLFPSAAAANPNVFYDKTTGEAKSLKQIYAGFAKKFDGLSDIAETRIAEATTTTDKTTKPAPILMPEGSNTPLPIRRAFASADTTADVEAVTVGASLVHAPVTLSNGVQIGKTTSTPFAAMMLAQMDMQTFGLNALAQTDKILASDAERKKSALNTLAQVG